ncbi:hypothetical protein J0H58_06455 [bacterium]|nr:hypothetical protein [bacterium]
MLFAVCLALGLLWSDGPRGAAPPVVRGVILPAVLPTGMTVEYAQRLLGPPTLYEGFGRPTRNMESLWYLDYEIILSFHNDWLYRVDRIRR